MDDYANRYGRHFVKLVDRRATMKEFEFDQILLMPTAKGYRALVEQARIEIKPRMMKYLSRKLSDGAIENLSFFAMAAAVFARSIIDPPIEIDVGRVLIRTVAFCNLRCAHRKEIGGGCLMAMNKGNHHLPKCIKLPRDIDDTWRLLKRYIATGGAICEPQAIGVHEAMGVEVNLEPDFAPSSSC
ncbi:Uncharacterised protein [uncultured archaeon]|nr:Uncharacterised protein [uncultured archaeon]